MATTKTKASAKTEMDKLIELRDQQREALDGTEKLIKKHKDFLLKEAEKAK